MSRLDPQQPEAGDGDWSAAVGRRWVLTHFDEVLTVNKERTVHWTKRSAVVKQWREAFGWLALAHGLPTNGSVRAAHIEAVPLIKGAARQDVAACLPVVKAAIDGLVDAGVWRDDSPQFIKSVRFWPQQKAKASGLRIIISETS